MTGVTSGVRFVLEGLEVILGVAVEEGDLGMTAGVGFDEEGRVGLRPSTDKRLV